MAQQVVIAGALFNDVPSISVPDSNSVWHQFVDPSVTTAAASDVASGKLFIAADGTLTQGTASGGGGSDRLTLIATKSLGTISTSSTSATNTGQTCVVEGFDSYNMLVCVCHTSQHTNGRHVATIRYINLLAASGIDQDRSGTNIAGGAQHWRLSNNKMVVRAGSTVYGVYVNGATLNSNANPRNITLTIYTRYSSNDSGTIDGDYVIDVYGMTLEDLV